MKLLPEEFNGGDSLGRRAGQPVTESGARAFFFREGRHLHDSPEREVQSITVPLRQYSVDILGM